VGAVGKPGSSEAAPVGWWLGLDRGGGGAASLGVG
jgi:hypothetical protein